MQILDLQLTSCVNLVRLFNFSEAQFAYLYNGDTAIYLRVLIMMIRDYISRGPTA